MNVGAARGGGVRAFAPGRIEIAGNHVDHQGGRVIAAAIEDGVEVVAHPNGRREVNVTSMGFGEATVRLDDLSPRTPEHGEMRALVRGVLAACSRIGARLVGFDAFVTSSLPAGGGLSSSAAFDSSASAH